MVRVCREVVRPACSATGPTSSTGCARTSTSPPSSCSTSRRRPARCTEAGLRNNISVGIQYLAAWLRGTGAVGHLQPHGGRRDRGDLPVAGVAVAAQRRRARRHRRAGHPRAGRAASSTRRSPGCPAATRPTTPRRGPCSSRSPSPTTSSSSSPSRPTSGCRDQCDARGASLDRCARSVGDDAIITDRQRLRTYECDGLAQYRVVPALVVLAADDGRRWPPSVRACADAGVPFVARGSGTGLSGGALPHADGVLIVTSRMRRDPRDRPRRTSAPSSSPASSTSSVTEAAPPHGYYYAPDPSSQQVCSIGGNVAENSGGAHCLKYGFTTNHVTGLEMVHARRRAWSQLGGKALDAPGYDLLGAFVGSEGTLGIATKVTVRLTRRPRRCRRCSPAFPGTDEAGAAVSAIIAAGVVPAAIEMMDALAIEAAEAAVHCGYPAGRRRGAHRRARRAGGRGGRTSSTRWSAFCREQRRVRDPDRGRRRRAGAVLEGAQVRVRRGRPDQPRLHRPGRRHPADRAAGGAAPHRRAVAARPASGSPTSSTPATATCTRWCCSTTRCRARPSGPRRSPARSSTCASSTAARSPASTASGVGQGRVHAADVHRRRPRHDAAGALRLRPGGLSNPGKVFPTPRLCGEVPGRHQGAHPLAEAGLAEVF